jgi:hypothetical protein
MEAGLRLLAAAAVVGILGGPRLAADCAFAGIGGTKAKGMDVALAKGEPAAAK